jgi:hypothetical protein
MFCFRYIIVNTLHKGDKDNNNNNNNITSAATYHSKEQRMLMLSVVHNCKI